MGNKQIFQAESPGRWRAFKWFSRTTLVLLIFAIICAIITLASKQYPELPNLESTTALSHKQIEQLKQSTIYKDFKVEKAQLQKLQKQRELRIKQHPDNKDRINAGFFVNWDPQSLSSLTDHIDKLDMVMAEFFFVDGKADTVITSGVNQQVLKLVREHKKPTLAMVSNFVGQQWDGDALHRILTKPASREKFIDDLITKLQKYKLQGVNIDFEEVQEKSNQHLIDFMKELYTKLHSKGFIVTQDISPDNEDYRIEELQKYNDYIVLMAYDQHSEESNPGDVSHQTWVETQLDNVCKKVPSEKVILALACYGFDWPKNSIGKSVTYPQAISVASQNKSTVTYNNESANLSYTYTDKSNILHTVYFTDAITNFNIMRKADDWGTAGVAIWRLGGEDPRIWSFITKDLSLAGLQQTGIDEKRLTSIGLNDRIDYAGEGEVLDLISTPKAGKVTLTIDSINHTITNEQYIDLPTKYVIKRYGVGDKQVVLTFDDGPDPVYTPKILDILKKEKVPGSFFVVGMMVENNFPILKRIYNEGHEIGNHTFSHPDLSQVGRTRVLFELNATRKLIECVTGRSTILFRAPFNADAEPQTIAEVLPVAQSRQESYINVGELVDPQDWQPGITADSIVARVIQQKDRGSVLLLHDAGGDRRATIEALPRIIAYYKKLGYQFTTVANLIGKTRDDVMPPIKTAANFGLTGTTDYFFITVLFWANKILFGVFMVAIFLAMFRVIAIGVLAYRQYYKSQRAKLSEINDSKLPPVSIIVPGYNEEVTVSMTIRSLLKLNYPSLDIIFVDDGSTDNTFNIVNGEFGSHPNVQVLTKPNGGKASALNFGISHCKNEYVVCIDADTQLHEDAVKLLLATFDDDEDIAAVAGTVKVGNRTNILTKWQSIEYITAQNMDRRAFDMLNSITVIPGAIGAFRKDVIIEAGGFTSDTLAEDCDLTMRILKKGYIVRNCDDALAFTEAPETVSMLLKQRFRWSFGVMQCFWKNKDALFNKNYGYFGMVGMPNILIYQIILPLFAPIADLFMLIALIGAGFSLFEMNSFDWVAIKSVFSLNTSIGQTFVYYFAFILVDMLVAYMAFKMEKEKYKNILYIIPQRFVWRQLMYFVLYKSVRKALKGELTGWGRLNRTGNVQESKNAAS